MKMPIYQYSDISILEFSGSTGIAVGQIANGALSCYNGRYLLNNCRIINNAAGIYGRLRSFQVEVSSCKFAYNDLNNFVFNLWGEQICMGNPEPGYPVPLVANNIFDNAYHSIYTDTFYFVKNSIYDSYNSGVYLQMASGISYIFDNTFNNCQTGINGGGEANIYIKNNTFTGGTDAINIDEAYVEISGNYFEGCDVNLPSNYLLNGILANNYFISSNTSLSGRLETIFNNIFFQNNLVSSVIGSSNLFSNNSIVNNTDLCNLLANTSIFENTIFLSNGMDDIEIMNNPIFRNCITDFPLDSPLVDGGGNIIIDSLQAQEIFEDIENGDFHLITGSIVIDAGFDTLGYYYPFDLENNVRVWDGDGDGNAIIDIGPYEYGAPQFGKIIGNITETESEEPVDYVLLLIDNEPGNFTFADSAGYFEIQLPVGTYDIYAERVFYENNIIYSVTVEDELTTEIEFNMTSTLPQVGIIEDELNINNSTLKISNYPNPFNPAVAAAGRSPGTTISYDLPVDSTNPVIEIFNIKGEKIVTLSSAKQSQPRLINIEGRQGTATWDGTDSNNKLVSSGIYFYKLSAGKSSVIKKMLLLK